ncbi:hypothetical protein FRB98_004070 [Tulasnella sp. 332]|nr:hypothetical protein FRB98_004070 [Tulasnella sp. 332]
MSLLGLRPRFTRLVVAALAVLFCLSIVIWTTPPTHPAKSHIRDTLAGHASQLKELGKTIKLPWNDHIPVTPNVVPSPYPNDRPNTLGLDPRTAHRYQTDGRVKVNEHGPHPIYELTAKAEREWRAKHTKSSRTLQTAISEYKKRYGRSPPPGFDLWWDYVLTHRVMLPDEYDQIHRDMEPFWGIQPEELQARQLAAEFRNDTFTISVRDAVAELVTRNDNSSSSEHYLQRSAIQLNVIGALESVLPDLRVTFNALDTPRLLLDHSYRQAAIAAARTNTAAMDVCLNPSYVHIHGFLQSLNASTPEPLFPLFSTGSTSIHGDVHIPSFQPLDDTTSSSAMIASAWDQKPFTKLYWRGDTSGTFHSPSSFWNITHRVRFVEAANEKTGDIWVMPSTMSRMEPVGAGERVERALINEEWVDVKFLGKPVQCDSVPRSTCALLEEMFPFDNGPIQVQKGGLRKTTRVDESHWKYLMDIDGNGPSSRFGDLLASHSLIFKSTIFTEWYTGRIQPWLHYVPIKPDFTDIYDIMAFFKGDIDGVGQGHDAMADVLARAGHKWQLTMSREEDMLAYVFRWRMASRDIPLTSASFRAQAHLDGLNASAQHFTSPATRAAADIQDDIDLQVELDHVDSVEYPLFNSIEGNNRFAQASHKIQTPWKRKLYKLFESPTSSQSAFIIHVASTTAIVFSACVTILETLPPFHATPTHVWFGIETSLVVLFTVEYIARLLAHSETWGDLFRWCGSFFAIVDLLAILPYFIEIAIQADTTAFFRFSILRTFRLLRVFRPFRYSSTILLTIEVMYLTVKRSQDALFALAFFVMMTLVVFSTLLYFAERGVWDDVIGTFVNSDGDPSQFESIPAAAWFVLVTITTVGYGEITPRSFFGRLVTVPLLMFGLLLIALPSFVLGREFSNLWEGMGGSKMLRFAQQRQVNMRDPTPSTVLPMTTGTVNQPQTTEGPDLITGISPGTRIRDQTGYPPSRPRTSESVTSSPTIPFRSFAPSPRIDTTAALNFGTRRPHTRRMSDGAIMGQISTLKLAENQQVLSAQINVLLQAVTDLTAEVRATQALREHAL